MAEFVSRYKRYAAIAAVFAKNDLGFVIDQVGLKRLLPGGAAPASEGQSDEPQHTLSLAERVRMVFEELGPTFVKMGQILSTRPDLIPREYIEQFRMLQDHVTEVPFEEVKEVVEGELGQTLSEAFEHFDSKPLAAASIGQVHRCTLKDGRQAVAKVQRPGIEDTIRQDLSVLYGLARMANLSSFSDVVDMMRVVQEFERSILRELDFTSEGRLTEEFANNFRDDAGVHIAQIYWEVSSRRLLVMEYLDGVNISDIGAIKKQRTDTDKLAKKIVQVTIRQVFFDGLFHADPHPGNLMLLPGGVLGIIDFGMTGRFDRHTLAMLRDVSLAVMDQDHVSLAAHLVDHDVVSQDVDLRKLRSDLRALFRDLASLPMAQASEALQKFTVDNGLRISPDLFFLDKTFGTLDGTIRLLSPNLDFAKAAREVFSKSITVKGIEPMLKELAIRLYRDVDAIVEIPVLIRRVLRRLDEAHLTVRLDLLMSDIAYRRFNLLVLKTLCAVGGAVVLAGAWRIAHAFQPGHPHATAAAVGGGVVMVLAIYAFWAGGRK